MYDVILNCNKKSLRIYRRCLNDKRKEIPLLFAETNEYIDYIKLTIHNIFILQDTVLTCSIFWMTKYDFEIVNDAESMCNYVCNKEKVEIAHMFEHHFCNLLNKYITGTLKYISAV